MKISLLPIDVGFDPKALGLEIDLVIGADTVIYKDKNNRTKIIMGSREEIKNKLIENGYKIK